ncbi:MAG: hypothetical protein H6732_10235 [Alphaproteobacteria bacterium]|nr:hypothetical protein [Alphaproteobacteria bacterium]
MDHPDGPEVEADPARGGGSVRVLVAGAALLLALLVWWRHAWVTDDAWISFRVADHLAAGRGLRWNVDERVQVFTNPLWTLALAGLGLLGVATPWSGWVLSLVVWSVGAGLVIHRLVRHEVAATVAVLVLLGSRTLVQWSSSGLETPLLTTGALALGLAATSSRPAPRQLATVVGGTALLGLVRLDALLLGLPWCLLALARATRALGAARAAAVAAVACTPLLAWLGFAAVYYGTPLPNTLLAKLPPEYGLARRVDQGLAYLSVSLRTDPVTAGLLALAVVGGIVRRRPALVAGAVAVILGLAWVVLSGGDYMVGRFLVGPASVALVVLLRSTDGLPQRQASAALVLLAACFAGGAITSHLPIEHVLRGPRAVFAPTPGGVVDQHATSWSPPAPGAWPWQPVFEGGSSPGDTVLAPGVLRVGNAGWSGWAAGQDVHVLDDFALGDALLARMPPDTVAVGHAHRTVPLGYPEWLAGQGEGPLDPRLRAYHAHVARLTRGPLWSADRAASAWHLLVQAPTFRTVDQLVEGAAGRSEDDPELTWCLEVPDGLLGRHAGVGHPVAQHDVLHRGACGVRVGLPSPSSDVTAHVQAGPAWSWALLDGDGTVLARGTAVAPGDPDSLGALHARSPTPAAALWLRGDGSIGSVLPGSPSW